jgi:hypothetical protein
MDNSPMQGGGRWRRNLAAWLTLLGVVAATQTACGTNDDVPSSSRVILHGVYALSGEGDVAALSVADDSHYELWRNGNEACAQASDGAACTESGTYELTADTLTLVDARTAIHRSYAFKALKKAEPESGSLLGQSASVQPMTAGSGSLLGGGEGTPLLNGEGTSLLAIASNIQLTKDNGSSEELVRVAGDLLLVNCGKRGDVIAVAKIGCNGTAPTTSLCPEGTPLSGKAWSGLGMGFCG